MHKFRPIRWFTVFLLSLQSSLLADNMTTTQETPPPPPPSYQYFRYDEDYSYLANPAMQNDWFDPIKYIPLPVNDPDFYVTFGGEVRERFEGYYDLNFGIGNGPDSYWLQRLAIYSDIHLGPRVRIFAEGISGLVAGASTPPPLTENDPIDLEFAFIDLVPYLTDDARLTVRTGRFGMYFGSGRLVAPRDSTNIPQRFDGVETIYSLRFWEATAFLTQPVADSGGLSGADHATTFWGLYLTHWFDKPHNDGLDVYYLGIHNKAGSYASGTGDEHRQSFGVREFGEWKQWDWNTEVVAQSGTFGNQSIRAWTASEDSGYTFDAKGQPRLGLRADVASGDSHPSGGPQGTFDPLYFKSPYFNDASMIRPANIIDVHPNASVNLTPTMSVNGGVDVIWRYSNKDAIYGPPGNVEVPALQTGTNYATTAVDVNLNWQIQQHISFGASYVHFFTGSYIHEAGGRDVDYVSTTVSFLF